MERRRYIHADSVSSTVAIRKKFLTQILKVMLEMITATTFVMLDRLFYEALDVVRRHAQVEVTQQGAHDLDFEVGGRKLGRRLSMFDHYCLFVFDILF